MEQNIQDLDAVPWMLIIFVLLILLIVGTMGFFIGRGTASKVDYRDYDAGVKAGYDDARLIMQAEYASKSTLCHATTTTILEEKKRCDEAGRDLIFCSKAWNDAPISSIVCWVQPKEVFSIPIK